MIIWWDNNELGKLELFMLFIKLRLGFTNILKMLPSIYYWAWIDGLYGLDRVLDISISDYGYIFMVVIGIGIGVQVPYIK